MIKEHDWDICCFRTRDTGHKPLWNEVKFIDCDPHYYTRKVKEVIHIRLNPDNINRDSGVEIPEAWMPTIKKHNNSRATADRRGSKSLSETPRIEMHQSELLKTNQSQPSCFIRSFMTSRPHHLKKTSSMRSKRGDLQNLRKFETKTTQSIQTVD